MLRVPEQEIRLRFRKLHNYEKVLYPQLKERSDRVRKKLKETQNENEKLKAEIRQLKEENKRIEKIQLELEEVKAMVFRKKKKAKEKEKNNVEFPKQEEEKKEGKRSKESYRKKEPKKEDITGEIELKIDECPDCRTKLIDKKEHICYREDLAGLDMLLKQAKRITKRIIESGYCPKCKKRKSKYGIPKQKVEVGINIKVMIVYLHILLGLSYKEVQEHFQMQYNLKISSGEITNSLEEQAILLKPYYQEIFDSLKDEVGCHYDETSWKVQKENEGNYAWVKTGVKSDNVIFSLGKSRGKGVAEGLRGDRSDKRIEEQVGISDDYGAYRSIFKNHALCWAHPHRKIRDLARSSVLEEDIRKHCQKVYEQFSKIYDKVGVAHVKFNNDEYSNYEEREKKIEKLKKELLKVIKLQKKDPKKLSNIKESMNERIDRYFICLRIKGIPLDNNKAERVIRKLVLHRKKSFGSKTQKGADTLSILYSVIFSIYWSNDTNDFLKEYYDALDLGWSLDDVNTRNPLVS